MNRYTAAVVACLVLFLVWRLVVMYRAGPSQSAMVIVEPRKHRHLRYVLENFDRNMPVAYDLYIFHGKSAGAFARRCAQNVARNRRVQFVALDTDNLGVDGYNALLTSPKDFWDKIHAENVLVFQTDTMLCSKSDFKISDFEHLGYVGCAYDLDAGKDTHWGEDAYWGVGGLSFRKKSAALQCLANMPRENNVPEDLYFSNCVEAGYGTRPADGNELSRFCSQGTFYNKSLGGHRLHDAMEEPHRREFVKYCPESKPLLDVLDV